MSVDSLTRNGDRHCPITGKVLLIDGTANSSTSSIMIKAQLDNHKLALVPGETIRVTISFGDVADAVVVPEQAMLDTRDGSSVYLVNNQGRVEIVPVRAGFSYDSMCIIESGLEAGQTVLVDGFERIRNGQEIRYECKNP